MRKLFGLILVIIFVSINAFCFFPVTGDGLNLNSKFLFGQNYELKSIGIGYSFFNDYELGYVYGFEPYDCYLSMFFVKGDFQVNSLGIVPELDGGYSKFSGFGGSVMASLYYGENKVFIPYLTQGYALGNYSGFFINIGLVLNISSNLSANIQTKLNENFYSLTMKCTL